MSEVVGSVYVRVRALTDKLNAEIQKGVEKGIASVDASSASDIGKDIVDSVGDGVEKQGKRTGTRIGKKIIQHIEDGAVPETGKFGTSIAKRFWAAFKQANDKDARKHAKSISSAFKKVFSGIKSFAVPGKFLLVGLAVPLVAKALVLIGQYLTVLVGQLGFVITGAVGAGIALAGMAGAGLLAFGAMKLGFTELSGDTQTALDATSERWELLGKRMSKRVQPGILPALRQLPKLISALEPAFLDFGESVGKSLGGALKRVIAFFRSARGMSQWGKALEGSKKIIELISRVLSNLAPIIMDVFVAALPSATRFAESLEKMFNWWRLIAQVQSDNGTLEFKFGVWYERARQFGKAISDLAVGLWNMMNVGATSAQPFFDRFSNFTAMFRVWTTSTEGQDRIKEIFDNARTAVHAFNQLLREVIRIMWGPVKEDQGGMASFFDNIRLKVLPWVENSFLPTMREIKEPLVQIVKAIAGVFAAMPGNTVDSTIKLLNTLADAITYLTSIPGIASFVGKLVEIGLVVITLSTVLKPLTSILGALTSSTVIAGLTGLGSGIASLFGVTLGTTLAASLAAIGIALAAIVAAVGAAYLIWRNWDTITEILSNIWGKISPIIDSIQNGLGRAIDDVKEKFNNVFGDVDFVGTLEGWIKKFTDFWDSIQAPAAKARENIENWLGNIIGFFGHFVEAAGALWDGFGENILQVVRGSWEMIEGIISGALDVVLGAVKVFISVIGGDWGAAFDGLKQIVSGVFTAITGIIRGFITQAEAIIKGVIKVLTWPFEQVYNILVGNSIVHDLVKALVMWFTGLPGKLVTALAGLVPSVVGVFAALAPKVLEIVGNLITGVINFFLGLPGKLLEIGTTIFTVVSEIGKGIVTTIGTFITQTLPDLALKLGGIAITIGNWFLNFVTNTLPEFVGSLVSGFFGFVTDIVTAIPEKMGEITTEIGKWFDGLPVALATFISNAASGIAGALGSAFNTALGNLPGGDLIKSGIESIGGFFSLAPLGALDGIAVPASPFLVGALSGTAAATAESSPFRQFGLSSVSPRDSAGAFVRDLARRTAEDSALSNSAAETNITIQRLEVVAQNNPRSHALAVVRTIRDQNYLKKL